MRDQRTAPPAYVIKVAEFAALANMPADYPRPEALEWIDRGRNTQLQRTTIEMLLRTISRDSVSAGVERLHEDAGLRVIFSCEEDRWNFAKIFQEALTASQ